MLKVFNIQRRKCYVLEVYNYHNRERDEWIDFLVTEQIPKLMWKRDDLLDLSLKKI